MDWIQGQKFWEIADMVFTPKEVASDDYYKLPNTFNAHKLNNNSIIYTHTMYVKQLFDILKLFTNGHIIVISHNSDVNIDESFRVPSCVKKWFTTNVDVVNLKIESIPIGLENDRWFPTLCKKDQMECVFEQQKNYKNIVYINFDIKTNKNKRQTAYAFFNSKPWVTATECDRKNGIEFNKYICNVYQHKFVVCPEGNGIDTHRVWETLYMCSIPILLKNTNYLFYKNLPICFVNNWEEVTEEFLQNQFEFILNRKTINMQMLTFEYWKNKILNERN
ncbi:MAG: hypothetical protein WC516_09225 [Patescibacteria group bacterium]|jgi:hypothetical protein